MRNKEIKKRVERRDFNGVREFLYKNDELMEELLQNKEFQKKLFQKFRQTEDESVRRINEEPGLPKVPSDEAVVGNEISPQYG